MRGEEIERHKSGREREKERKKEAILVPQRHVCVHFAFFFLVSSLGKRLREIDIGEWF